MDRLDSVADPLGGGERHPEDRRFELLADERRRCVIACLREASSPVTVADLARRVLEREAEGPAVAAPNRRAAAKVSLYHCHLPKLAEASVVEFDPERNTVEPGADFDRIASLWSSLTAEDDSGSEDS